MNSPIIETYGAQKRFIAWKLETRKGKTTKLPYQLNGKLASSTDPTTWATYDEIKAKSDKVGIVLHDSHLLVIDLDHILDDGGKVRHAKREQIIELLKRSNTFIELSQSKSGLHIYLALTEPITLTKNKSEPIEAYVSGRYIATTGESFGKVRPIRTITPDEANELLAIVDMVQTPPLPEQGTHTTYLNAIDSSVLLTKMFEASNGDEVRKLYDGDMSKYGNDASRADAALLSHLAFWTGKNAAQMEKMWLASPLGARSKTATRPDYRTRTINKAIFHCDEGYNPELKGTSEIDIEDVGLLFSLKGKQKVYYKNTENITRILQKHPDFANTLRFDEYRSIIERRSNESWHNLEDYEAVDIQTKISVLFSDFAHVSKEMVYDAIIKVARDNKIDSGIDYIQSLVWDGKERLDTWLSLAYGTPHDEYHKTVGSNWLKGLVKRILEPGCKFDYVLVLESKQGKKKSMSFDKLAGSLGYVETTLSTDQKDFFLLMQGNAIIEFSEGETLSRAEAKQLKSVISTRIDKYRAPYGRATMAHPRRCVFAMTTNQSEYLKDDTGNRRWLPVTVIGEANVEWIAENREQLIAEAYHRVIVKNETVYEFPEDELEEQQIARRIKDPNIDVIVNWYWSQPPSWRENGVSVSDIYINALHSGFMTKPMTRNDEMGIADVLRTWLQLEPQRIKTNGIRSYRYFMTEKTQKLQPAPEDMPQRLGIHF